MPTLRIRTDGSDETTHTFETEAVVGRAPPADIVVPDRKVSRQHCRFARRGASWAVEDMGSSNGMLVNGVRRKLQPLNHGDKIEVGLTEIVFESVEQKKIKLVSKRGSTRDRLKKKKK